MGVNAKVRINEEWKEPAIVWNVIAARKGEKKTAAMKRLLSAVEVRIEQIALIAWAWLKQIDIAAVQNCCTVEPPRFSSREKVTIAIGRGKV